MELIQEADRSKWMLHSNHNIKHFTKDEIDRMTNNYRTSLGSGAFGEVYEGVLGDGSMVAVKRFINNVKENFAKELIVHRGINHRNVLRLIGCCEEENALMLVTEYISNGNLSDVLHHDNHPIPLDVRLRIAIECAEALAYMHSHMYTQVIHGDIKPGNILLDSTFHANLSDFGISRVANTDKTLSTNNVIGSIGYMDPLFALDGRLTVKNDVYSFGVVLFELITRKKATTVVDNVNIVYTFTNALARGVRGVREMFDDEIASNDNMKILERVAKLAGQCLKMDRNKRPEMIDVAERLRVIRKSLHQDQGQERIGLFFWVRKSRPAPSAASTIPAKIDPLPAAINPCRRFSLAEMKAATNMFDKSLLFDPSGRVYLGNIDQAATKVAVKDVRNLNFRSLIEMMSKLRHAHLVPLIGYCNIKGHMLLVHEYMARGNMREHLYTTQKPPLSWKQRMEACIGIARGLRYLHELQIIHGNLKLTNILLDEEWTTKITDLAPPETESEGYVSAVPLSSCAYIDPEYILSGRLTEKSDVYSFGVVLFEVLCARPVGDRSLLEEEEEEEDEEEGFHYPSQLLPPLLAWVLRCKEKGNLEQIVDPHLKGTISKQCLNKFVDTAAKCVAALGINRPAIVDVFAALELLALELQFGAEMGVR